MTALVFGGAASGKSAYGEALVCSLPRRGPLIYLATMDAGGAESAARIARHRAMRAGKGFVTLERGRGLADCPIPEGSAVLLEDLGNLAANELFSGPSPDINQAYQAILHGLEALAAQSEHLIVISVDLFRDGEIYPRETELYLSLMARLHAALAARADRVAELVCGLPVLWKGECV